MFDPYITSATIGAGVSLGLAFFKWLSYKFNKIEAIIKAIEKTTREAMDKHEDKDQHRHEENIVRFAVIETQLNRVISNGKH